MRCYTCNQIIHRPPSQLTGEKNFCNHECYSKFKARKWSKQNNPRWRGGDDKFKCKICFKPCERKKYGKKQNKYCSIKCAAKDRDIKGEKHWNWKGGKNRYQMKFHPKPLQCEVCKALGSSFKKGLQFDHCHKTGEFRGWLCSNCNTSLGLVKEDVKRLEALIKYLQ